VSMADDGLLLTGHGGQQNRVPSFLLEEGLVCLSDGADEESVRLTWFLVEGRGQKDPGVSGDAVHVMIAARLCVSWLVMGFKRVDIQYYWTLKVR
jgi:hypothetical protein